MSGNLKAGGSRERLELLDWKRRIFEVYREVREVPDPRVAWDRWRATRDALFANHPQSPIPSPARRSFEGLAYYDYDPAARVLADLSDAVPEHLVV